jgi:hypothetical protein
MTHEQAIARCAQLNADDNRDREWFPREVGPDDWEIVSVDIPGLRRVGPLNATIESRPRPSEPPDPRTTIIRNIPPYGAG